MACKIANLVAFILCAAAAFSALFSLEPKTIGGVMKRVNRDPEANADESQWLYHPFYISMTHNFAGEKPDDYDCVDWSETDTDGNDRAFPYGEGRGLSKKPSCRMNILHATGEPVNLQRAYAAYIMGGFNGALRRWWYQEEADVDDVIRNTDYNGTGNNLYNSSDNSVGAEAANNMLDVIFKLVQLSGAFLALGMALNVLALVMGGFIWKLSDKCNYGICALLFNSTILASFSVVCYIISLASFVMVFYQGQEVNADQQVMLESSMSYMYYSYSTVETVDKSEYVTKYSIGGVLIIGAIVLELIAIGLASWQWIMDKRGVVNVVQVRNAPPQYNV